VLNRFKRIGCEMNQEPRQITKKFLIRNLPKPGSLCELVGL
jgi:hypothetical protein